MCEQCTAETVDLGEFAPGWVIVRATRDGNYMKSGQLGLVVCNDPEFYLSTEPVLVPRHPNGKINNDACWDDFFNACDIIRKDIVCDPVMGHYFLSCCRRVGYGKKGPKNLDQFSFWLTDRLARVLAKNK